VPAHVDPRVEGYARLIVERSLDVQPGWQVLVRSTPLARPMVEELARQVARRGAYLIERISLDGLWPVNPIWAAEAPDELLGELPEIERHACDSMDARITLAAPENTREGKELDGPRRALATKAGRYFFRRTLTDLIPWVSCQYPTNALAQDAGMSLTEYEDFFYGSILLDWDAIGAEMQRHADRFDQASEVRIVGAETDLTLSLDGRQGQVDSGRSNLPGGEFYFAPVEDSAQGVITYSEFPSVEDGQEVTGARLVFEQGRIVEASAVAGEDFLISTLDTDEGARRLGELGIGCNPRITRHMKNTLFDEKMAGTIHLAVGSSYTKLGGTNVSAIHWDMVKDLRNGGRIYLDGELVQENGRWLD
jgi:aminopeptidase